MATVSFAVPHYGWTMQFEVEFSGSLVCGRGPDDSVPDIHEQRGWLENGRGEFIRDFLPREIEVLLDVDTPADKAMWDAIEEHQYEGYGGDYDYDG